MSDIKVSKIDELINQIKDTMKELENYGLTKEEIIKRMK